MIMTGEVLPFKRHDAEIEHVDSSTIVERIEMTDELKQLFKENGYNYEDEENADQENES